jgi:hypoxanthine phosphoribosyltransferase
MSEEIGYYQLGESRFYGFCRVIKDLAVKQNKQFDLVVAVGNTGLIMGKFAEMIYQELDLVFPPQLTVPFVRFQKGFEENVDKLFDNSYLLPEIIEQIKNIAELKNVLFVDDEIGRGITAKTCLKLLNQALADLGKPSVREYYVVAEDMNFQFSVLEFPEIRFVPYAKDTHGINNVIFFITPEKFQKPIREVLGDERQFAFFKITSLLLGLPVKDHKDALPVYTDEYLKIAQAKIPDFAKLQTGYQEHLKKLIKNCLNKFISSPTADR